MWRRAGRRRSGRRKNGMRRRRRTPPPPPLPMKQMWPLHPKGMRVGGFGGSGPHPGPGRQGGLHSLADSITLLPFLLQKGLQKPKPKGLQFNAKGLAKAKATGPAKAKAKGGKLEGDGPGDLAKGKNLAKGENLAKGKNLGKGENLAKGKNLGKGQKQSGGDPKGLGKAKRRKGLEKGEPKETKPLANSEGLP